mgnify:CR=1 FL=1
MAIKPYNPFLLSSYIGPDYFCDREKETERLISNMLNGVNTTMISVRRMGKTGLLKHVAHQLKEKGIICIYIDIFTTQNLREFTIELMNGIFKAVPQKTGLGKKFVQLLQNLRAILSFDLSTGHPQYSLEYSDTQQYVHSLSAIFQLLEKQEQTIVIMIDEFQQILNYPEKAMEALLRTHIQQLRFTHFIFSGSNKHVLSAMFGDQSRPFYNSTQWVDLHFIDEKAYSRFIRHHFVRGGKQLDDDVLAEVLRFTKRHTYYTQAVCNRLYTTPTKKPDVADVVWVCNQLLEEQKSVFLQYRQLLTPSQWRLLEAIALEDIVYAPTAKKFLKRYDLGASSAVQRSLAALEQKEMIFKENTESGTAYQVYDQFLCRWLQKNSYHPPRI